MNTGIGMKTRSRMRPIGALAAAALVAVAAPCAALAQHAGGGAGGGHVAAGHIGGGFVSGHAGRAGPGRPGGGFGRGYGGYYGWRGYGWGPSWGLGWGWGWTWGWPLGIYVAALPWYYTTFWWDGVPYYFADGSYYVWSSDVGQYERIEPSPELIQQRTGRPNGGSTELFAYPKNGQSTAQQATDKAECRRWATDQTGFDPAKPSAGAASSQDYLRAETACLEGRGYSVG